MCFGRVVELGVNRGLECGDRWAGDGGPEACRVDAACEELVGQRSDGDAVGEMSGGQARDEGDAEAVVDQRQDGSEVVTFEPRLAGDIRL